MITKIITIIPRLDFEIETIFQERAYFVDRYNIKLQIRKKTTT